MDTELDYCKGYHDGLRRAREIVARSATKSDALFRIDAVETPDEPNPDQLSFIELLDELTAAKA